MFQFESSVISYGSKTLHDKDVDENGFESSVISYGSKTDDFLIDSFAPFESSVISYGSKTIRAYAENYIGLRVV